MMTTIAPASPPLKSETSDPNVAQSHTAKAAKDFEAMVINEMLQPMFDTAAPEAGALFSGGDGEKQLRPMLVNEMAKEMEKAGGLGLVPAIYRQMLSLQEKK